MESKGKSEVRKTTYYGNPDRECDGLDFGGGQGVGGMWLDLGCFGVRADRARSAREKEESRMHPGFWPHQLGEFWYHLLKCKLSLFCTSGT